MLFNLVRTLSGRGSTKLPPEVEAVIGAARIDLRHFDEDEGSRIIITLAGPLRGAFVYDKGEAKKRIEARWPWLNAGQVRAACNFLEARVTHKTIQTKPRARKSWVLDY